MIEYALITVEAMLLKCLRKMMDVGIGIMMDYHMEEVLIQEEAISNGWRMKMNSIRKHCNRINCAVFLLVTYIL